jgi:CO dehydrogenase/acetyl-CoA synthase delta subunit
MDAAYSIAVERFGADSVYIGHISKQPKVESAPALYHGLIHARL